MPPDTESPRQPTRPSLRAALAAGFMLLGTSAMADTTASAGGFQIDIDEGTVNVIIEATPRAEPYELTYMPQGSCVPEVMITTMATSVTEGHVKNCHGTGRNEGTIFSLKLSATQTYGLNLKAGRLNISGALGESGLNHFNGTASVGGITNRRDDLNVTISRRRLVGAVASFGNADDNNNALKATVTYGQINIF